MSEYIDWLPGVSRETTDIMAAIRKERDETFPLNYFLTLRMQFHDSEIRRSVEEASDCIRARLPGFHQRGFESGCLLGLRVLDEIMPPVAFNRLAGKLSSLIAQEEQFATEHYNSAGRKVAVANGLLGYAAEGMEEMNAYVPVLCDAQMLLMFGDEGVFAATDGFGLLMATRHEVLQDLEVEAAWEAMLPPTSTNM